MTKEEILKMEAKELTRMVAEKMMGWKNLRWQKRIVDGSSFSPEGWFGDGPNNECYLTESYPTSISAVWEVEEKIRKEKLIPEYVDALIFVVEFDNIGRGKLLIQEKQWLLIHARADQKCRAALMAMMEDQNE